MPKLFIIAGSPGIGRSTNGRKFVPPTAEILNHDSYNNTLPLLQKHLRFIESIQFINVVDDEITPDLVYSIRYPTAKEEYIHPELPHWLIQVFTKISLLFGK